MRCTSSGIFSPTGLKHGRWGVVAGTLLLSACVVVGPPRPTPPPAAPWPVAAPAAAVEPARPLPPYPAAVAARFSDPAVTYLTPGLRPGRLNFSTTTEIQAWFRDLAAASAANTSLPTARVLPLGPSQRGEAIDALILVRGPYTDSARVVAAGRPTVLLIGQQHGDEPAPAEALLVLARDLAQGSLRPVLDHINVIIVPRANPDGAAAGLVTTASGVDLATDHLALDTPEARALARLARDYRPMVVADFHEYAPLALWRQKFNAVGRSDALVQQALLPDAPEFLARASEEWFRRPLLAALKGQGLTSEWLNSLTPEPSDMTVSMGGPGARSLRNVQALQNTVSLQVESRGIGLDRWHLQRRVHTLVVAGGSILRSTAAKAPELAQLRSYVDREVSAQACTGDATLAAALTPVQYDLTLLNPQTGAERTLSVDWNSALALRKLRTRARPCGYLLAPSATLAVQRLRQLGVQVYRVGQSAPLAVESYRVAPPPAALELVRGTLEVPVDSYYVPLAQARGRLVVAALEPDAPDSLLNQRVVTNPLLTTRALVDASAALKLEPIP